MLIDKKIKEFIEVTAGNDPVPGGGSISALAGTLASALGEMVAGLTVGRKKYADVQEEMEELIPRFTEIRNHLMNAIDEDSKAYDEVFQAFKLPKETDEQKALRSQAIQVATIKAAEVPLGVAKWTVALMPMIKTVAEKGNSNAVTDACVAMMCARTAVRGAVLNVRINLTSLKDAEYVENTAKVCNELEMIADKFEHELLKTIKL